MHWKQISLVQKLIAVIGRKKLINRYWHSALCQYLMLAMRNTLKLGCKGLERISIYFCNIRYGKNIIEQYLILAHIEFQSNKYYVLFSGFFSRIPAPTYLLVLRLRVVPFPLDNPANTFLTPNCLMHPCAYVPAGSAPESSPISIRQPC
jgi:hypothetical protein